MQISNPHTNPRTRARLALAALILASLAAGCGDQAAHDPIVPSIPELMPANLDGRRLSVVATTSIIGDVVANVGGESIDLAVLLRPGVDSHSFQPTSRDLIAVEEADVIFVNGWDLEGSLLGDLEAIGGEVIIVPISAGITPRPSLAAAGDRSPDAIDPHVWFDVRNVMRWVENVSYVLGEVDPDHAAIFSENAAAYLETLEALDAQIVNRLAGIPEDNRFIVTNHDALGYFAFAYGFEVIATVIPAASTLAEPSASDLAELVEEMSAHGVCTIFTETSVSDQLAQTVAAELASCEDVRVIPLYTEALGPPGSGADTFIGMFTANIDAILEGLK